MEGADPPAKLNQSKRTSGEMRQHVRPTPYRKGMTPGKDPAYKG